MILTFLAMRKFNMSRFSIWKYPFHLVAILAMLRMTGGWTSLDAGRKFSDTNCGFPQRSQPQSPPRPRKLWSHRRTSIFSKNFRDLGKFPCCLRFFAELCKFPRHLYFPKIREFPGCQNCLKNSRKLCKFPGHPILDFNLPGRRPICTSVIPPPPVFSAADNCELTERPHKCLDSDTTALKYIPPSAERYSSQDILTSINQPRQKSLMYRSEKSVLSRLHEVMTGGTSEIYQVFKLPDRSILNASG